MTPGARLAAAIKVLDQIAKGSAAEQALTRWARNARYAGSKDRAAVRDHVFDVVRMWRSTAALGGAETGRARAIGVCRAQGLDTDALFTGDGHAPLRLTAEERAGGGRPASEAAAWDLPDWLLPLWHDALGADAEAAALASRHRAPLTLRTQGDIAEIENALAREGVKARRNPRAEGALTVSEGARRVQQSKAWASGQIDWQDASSQAVVDMIAGQGRALDYCAGGGGKALALAQRGWTVTAHDIDPRRMKDVPQRAARLGHRIRLAAPGAVDGRFDLVLCDAPCSGSGAWRRAPHGKWALTQARLAELLEVQQQVLRAGVKYVAPGGLLVYVTCSVLRAENEDAAEAFVRAAPDWRITDQARWPINADGDGFFAAHLRRV